jgi:hypothetical protein
VRATNDRTYRGTTERIAALRAHGDHVYARSKAWSAEAWRVSVTPLPASLEVLDDWLEAPESIAADLW